VIDRGFAAGRRSWIGVWIGMIGLAVGCNGAGIVPEVPVAHVAKLARWQVYFLEPFALTPPEAPPNEETLGQEEFRVRACRGQTALMSFSVWARREIRSVSVFAEDFTHVRDDKNVIPASRVDVRIVRWWTQAGRPDSPVRGDATRVPELLVKDDAEPLDGPLPDIRLQGVPVTDVPAGTSKHFWVTIDVPPYIPSGEYRGRLHIQPAGQRGRYITISLLVMRFDLVPLDRVVAVLYERPTTPELHARAALELADMRAHGVTAAACPDASTSLPAALRLRYEMGLRGPTPVTAAHKPEVMRSALAAARAGGWGPVWWYGHDEPRDVTARLHANRKLFGEVHGVGGKTALVTSTVEASQYGDLLDTTVLPLMSRPHARQWTSLDPSTAAVIAVGRRSGDIARIADKLIHFNATMEDPRINRLLTGVYLGLSGLRGVVLDRYMAPNDRFAFNETEGTGTFRTPNLVYPSLRGPIGTLQWEAVREGIYDLRYLLTLQSLIQETRHRPTGDGAEPAALPSTELLIAVAEARKAIDSIRRRVGANYRVTLDNATATDLANMRLLLLYRCEEIAKLLYEPAEAPATRESESSAAPGG